MEKDGERKRPTSRMIFFFFNDTATTEIYTLSLHDALPISSVDELVRDAERARRLGLGGIILFGLPAAKDATGSEAYDEQGIVQQAARAVKRAAPELLVIGDACLCEYTDHGHCGVVQDGEGDNDASVYLLGKVAGTHARAGVHIGAPNDMMDGRVAGIRKALDAAGFSRVPIMSYAAKMASAFYGPFRED